MKSNFRKYFYLYFLAAVISGIFVAQAVQASQSSYSASGFAQFCADNPSTCTKQDFDSRSASLSCPSNTQVISNTYVHAGDGQTVWELPDSKFTHNFTNNQNTVNVVANTGTHDISWVGVVCAEATSSPSSTPSSSPSPSVSPSPLPSCPPGNTCIVIDCPGAGECSVVIGSPSPSPTPSLTPTPSPTPTPSSDNSSSSNSDTGSVASITGSGSVLGATTLADTGIFTENVINLILLTGLVFITCGAFLYAKTKNN